MIFPLIPVAAFLLAAAAAFAGGVLLADPVKSRFDRARAEHAAPPARSPWSGECRVLAPKHERDAQPRHDAGHPPWSASLPVLDAAAEARQRREDFARAQLAERAPDPKKLTDEALTRLYRDTMAAMRAIPVPEPVYGVEPVATVLAAEQAREMQP